MNQQLQNPHAAKLDEQTVSNASPRKRIDRLAEKAAEKSTKTELQFDKDNSNLFSK